ncbi:uncharacterized protein PFL1_05259 [Pseudozyma flocculosa PF-1]|uniref:OPT family small oligopeptide transporter n=2 Tax=Pseudozyma flocculosa TaxID=84751 RepID=A0A061H3E8_9BASI|nr:uncharacterized protein PFL1_05259 [Pseudozyma flocculosa PF-1]EPQ27337.1 hypothetical protein PFL1_05259 [Pseudozyma flocculosa PF-1]SPO39712.1 probable oligopeptide transporter [Pseudozyma flocculosa]
MEPSSRPTTGRPRTGRPTTGRPTTGRPGTRAGTSSGRPVTRGAGQPQQYYDEHEEEEWDEEEDYESEDDGDVFAFVPPDLGPAPELQSNPLDPSLDNGQANAAHPSQQQPHSQAPSPAEEEAYYFDEATGAVYDSQGRLVQMPSDFDPSTLMESTATADHARGSRVSGATMIEELRSPDGAPAYRQNPGPDTSGDLQRPARASTDNRSYDSTSTASRDVSGAPLTLAKSYAAFPSMDTLPEVDSTPASRDSSYRNSLLAGRKDLGTTASGGITVDRQVPMQAVRPGTADRRAAAFESHVHQLRRSPDSDVKYPLDSGDYTFEIDPTDKLHRISIDDGAGLGRGDGLAHPHMEGIEMGSHGMRMVELEMEMEEDSPYPEVRASVSNIDDPDMPVATFRTFFISFLLTVITAGGNMFFSLRYPAPSFSSTIVLLVAYPIGKLMAAVLPYRVFTLPRLFGGYQWSLNPGVYNIKEHALCSIMASVAIQQAYAFNVLIVEDSPLYYNEPKGVGFAILFVLSSQLIGFGLAGICRRFLVWPASMIWPQNLVAATILNTFHAEEDGADGSMTRFRFFTIASIAAFFFYFVPGFLFQGLSVFNWVCWIFPTNVPVNVVFGVASGLGFSLLTFDWTQISWIGSPLVMPWWAECNIFAGFVGFFWIIAPAMYFTNTWFQAYLPFNSSSSFDRFGQSYDIARVIPDGRELDRAAYEAYSPLYLSTTLSLVYTTGFATMTAVLTHTALYHGKALVRGFKRIKTEEDDVHAKFMRHYPECPDWWYAVLFLGSFALAVIMIEVYDTGMPVWALLISVLIPTVYILPIGFVYAMTGQAIGTNLIAEFAAGYLMPGRPLPNMIFKAFALQGLLGGLVFVQDLKLGHYMKIPPRLTFAAQLMGTVLAAFVQLGVKEWMFSNISNICDPSEPHRFTCPHISVFYTASLIWGVIGPDRMFGHGAIYQPIYYAMLFGALIPIPFWLLSRRYPRSWVRNISWPVILTGTSYIPPATGINFSSWFAVGFIFQYLLRRYNFRWWSKYNFVLTAALDSGTIFSILVIFFALSLPKNGTLSLNWWGNTIFQQNYDAIGQPLKMPPQEGFGTLPRF